MDTEIFFKRVADMNKGFAKALGVEPANPICGNFGMLLGEAAERGISPEQIEAALEFYFSAASQETIKLMKSIMGAGIVEKPKP